MPELTDGVEYDQICREWRCKWSTTDGSDKLPLQAVQKILMEFLPELQAVPGVATVQRLVCGGCYDFKVITTVSEDKWGDWESKGFAPEEKFLAAVKAVPGVAAVESQSMTTKTFTPEESMTSSLMNAGFEALGEMMGE
mmetsp:Transcript_14024/g.16994  ORF Transcript_14024/g.16994 Transcript_14024/m.16994 type:complete len:139 (-) Transcript_14024:361-777(-)|eukprot:CAMPEP_0197859844 /NCGR_PEP_ID=MMETSP1438-20131217/34778_1 /TAXON_ID=1461541 /ORGANISM="Pterosperma sp., Strain CCMP1384" /LENGTH=138 /DNA_ID=CAMNT_0043476503 /DNA_START=140 /DNA_END=556 /DNA_ORIENTATION=+